MPSAISWTLVPVCEFVIIGVPCAEVDGRRLWRDPAGRYRNFFRPRLAILVAMDALDAPAGDQLSILHSTQGRLLLSSYRNEGIRSAVHRLNAEEADLSRHVRVAELLSEFAVLREKGWAIEHDRDGIGCVAVLLPFGRNMDRLSVSVIAQPAVIAERGQEMLDLLLSRKERIAELHLEEDDQERDSSNVVKMPETIKIASYRRHFA